MKILNIRKDIMGTISFEAKFNGMRKSQEFIVYPISADDTAENITIQSDTRIWRIDLNTGNVLMSPPRSGGSYNIHLVFASVIDKLSTEELAGLKFRMIQTSSPKAGESVVHCDNSGAGKISIFSII